MPIRKLDKARRSELHYAARDGNVSEILRLISMGADIHFEDVNGYTPLHFAAQEHKLDATRILLQKGSNIEAKDKLGNTPLWLSVFYYRGNGEEIKLLRENGANPYAANKSGVSPFQLARNDANPELAKFFDDLL